MCGPFYVGVDVGTGSARAALVTAAGKILRTHTQNISIWKPRPGYFEQSSVNIWETCINVIRVSNRKITCDGLWMIKSTHYNY